MKLPSHQILPICLVLSLSGTAKAEDGGFNLSEEEKRDPVLIYKQAGINLEQETKIRQLAHDYEKSAQIKAARIRNLAKEIRELSLEPELDETKIFSIQDEMNIEQAKLNKERVQLLISIRSLLNSEQRLKLVADLKERAQK